jgi:chromosome segregation ATPase
MKKQADELRKEFETTVGGFCIPRDCTYEYSGLRCSSLAYTEWLEAKCQSYKSEIAELKEKVGLQKCEIGALQTLSDSRKSELKKKDDRIKELIDQCNMIYSNEQVFENKNIELQEQISQYQQTLKSIKDKVEEYVDGSEIRKFCTVNEYVTLLQQINSMLKEVSKGDRG